MTEITQEQARKNARQNLRFTIHEFLLTATCEEDEEAWERNLKTYDDLLAEVERLREAALDARIVLMKHYDWMSMHDSTSMEDDEEILTVVRALREASE